MIKPKQQQQQQRAAVTRFAPSPTGFLHIGGARTALFNWLFARQAGGKMLLRIEDTDRARSTPEATAAILDGLKWLGLNWDGEPISQYSRRSRHQQVADQMLGDGTAYRCYCSPLDVQEMRAQAKRDGVPFRHRCCCRSSNNKTRHGGADVDVDVVVVRKSTVRLRTPIDGVTILDDMVKGRQVTPNKELDDFVLVRSDGTPTYMLAVVVDDHDMGVTHIIRGIDHQTNAAKQILIYNALGWDIPAMAHIPLIQGMDGSKMSKRHGAAGVGAYRSMGYLRQAMRNYLVRLGWSHGDDEIMSLSDMIKWFGLDAVGNQSGCKFDFRKLDNLNGHYIRMMDDKELLSQYKMFLLSSPALASSSDNDIIVDDAEKKMNDDDVGSCLAHNHILNWMSAPANEEVLLMALPALKQRAKKLSDFTQSSSYLWRQRPLDIDTKASSILNTDDAKTILSNLCDSFLELHDEDDNNTWTANNLELIIKSHHTKTGVAKLGQIIQPLRAALTGRGVTSRGIYDILVDLGKNESIARIKDQLK